MPGELSTGEGSIEGLTQERVEYVVKVSVHLWLKLWGLRAGAILLMASAGGLFPMPISPVYAASKVDLLAQHYPTQFGPMTPAV
jgi:short-subunit dehydrogenase